MLSKLMFEKQCKLNDLTFPEWREKLTPNDWQRAIVVEAGEALDSLAYKWWKKQDIDLENVKVELIDILHFVLSLAAYEDADFSNFENNFDREVELKDAVLAIAKERNIDEILKLLANSFYTLGLSLEDVFKAYMTKNVLNEFRQKNGYKEGSYKKMWNGREDNEVAFEIALKLEADENFEKVLFNELEKVYGGLK